MDRPTVASGPKVSQIANLFQRRPSEMEIEPVKDSQQVVSQVTRSESHSTRFNNARALFEKLGVENPTPRPAALSLRLSNSSSREDNLCGAGDEPADGDRTPSPKRNKYPVSNGLAKRDPTKIHNTSRNKVEKPEKPEKPERKFNSKELIEKQKNWTSHFTKTRSTRFNSDPNRCDIIRAVPTAVHYPVQEMPPIPLTASPVPSSPAPIAVSTPPPPPPISAREMQRNHIHSRSVDSTVQQQQQQQQPKIPPSPPVRHVSLTSASTNSKVPDVKPRLTSQTSVPASPPPPVQLPPVPVSRGPLPNSPVHHSANNPLDHAAKITDIQEKRKRSIEMIDSGIASPPVEYAQVKKHSIDLVTSTTSAQAISSSPSPALSASSPPSSPTHTEDEKQEIEPNEKTDLYDEIITECKYNTNSYIITNY